MLRKIGFLTQEQFERATQKSRVSSKGLLAAHRVLVLQQSQSEVAKDINVSREKVRQYCFSVYKKHVDITGCPTGWITTTVCLPEKYIKEVQALEKKLRLALRIPKN